MSDYGKAWGGVAITVADAEGGSTTNSGRNMVMSAGIGSMASLAFYWVTNTATTPRVPHWYFHSGAPNYTYNWAQIVSSTIDPILGAYYPAATDIASSGGLTRYTVAKNFNVAGGPLTISGMGLFFANQFPAVNGDLAAGQPGSTGVSVYNMATLAGGSQVLNNGNSVTAQMTLYLGSA